MLTSLPPELLWSITTHLPLPDLTALLATSVYLTHTLLLCSPTRLLHPHSTGETLLHSATAHPALLAQLPLHLSPVDRTTGFTPLHSAARSGALAAMKLLLGAVGGDAGVVDAVSAGGLTAVEIAASEGHVEIVQVLLEAGAEAGRAAVWAAGRGRSEVVRVLLEEKRMVHGEVAAAAAAAGQWRVLEIPGLWVGGTDGMGSPHVVTAAKLGRRRCVEVLIRGGSSVDAMDVYGWTALHWAVFCGHREVAEVLLRAGAEEGRVTDAGEGCGELAEWWGAWRGCVEVGVVEA